MAVIEVEQLTKAYGGRTVVDGISFAVERGEIFGIVGPNGAGKTVTVETIEGLRTPDGGRVRVLGKDPIDDRAEVTQALGAQLQESRLQERPSRSTPRSTTIPRIPLTSSSVSASATSWTPATETCPGGRSSGCPWHSPWSDHPRSPCSTS